MAKIVIADDDADVLNALVEQVQELGHEVVGTATTGEEAYAVVCEQKPDVAIFDIRMGAGDGIQAARDIYDTCPTPIIFLTGYAEPELVEEAAQAGAFAYLVKPVRIEELMTNIEMVRRRFEEIRQRQKELERVKRDLANRRILERAKGFLMDKYGMTEMRAYRVIHQAARNTGRTLGEVSQEVIDTGKPPEIPGR
ncbi:MAG: putative transcriptional regulatory protein pdtaR [Fimbriimonadales bacterium]|jgi:response regulator NasT|nr:MAG: putative transcriptional regulatory protein pdtaR [Fimbriimonadales bacterium]